MKQEPGWSSLCIGITSEHQHCTIQFVTPNQRHSGLDRAILENRKKVIEQAKKGHPERWNGRKTRDLTPLGVVYSQPWQR